MLVNEFDEDGNGIIDFTEFLVMMQRQAKVCDTEEDFRMAVRILGNFFN